jgi:hypothetical protein
MGDHILYSTFVVTFSDEKHSLPYYINIQKHSSRGHSSFITYEHIEKFRITPLK